MCKIHVGIDANVNFTHWVITTGSLTQDSHQVSNSRCTSHACRVDLRLSGGCSQTYGVAERYCNAPTTICFVLSISGPSYQVHSLISISLGGSSRPLLLQKDPYHLSGFYVTLIYLSRISHASWSWAMSLFTQKPKRRSRRLCRHLPLTASCGNRWMI